MNKVNAMYFRTSLEALIALACHAGATPEFVRSTTENALEQAKQRKASADRHERHVDFEKTEESALVLDRWFTSPNFTNERGEPIGLRANGLQTSLEQLIEETRSRQPDSVRTLTSEEFLQIAMYYDVVRTTEDLIYPIQRTFRAKGMVADRVSRLTQYSARFNTECLKLAENSTNYGFSRCAYETEFPTRSLPWIKSFMEEQGMAFLTLANEQLCKLSSRRETDTTLVSIGCYLHVDDSRQQVSEDPVRTERRAEIAQ